MTAAVSVTIHTDQKKGMAYLTDVLCAPSIDLGVLPHRVEIQTIVKGVVVGQADIWQCFTLQFGEVVLDAASKALRAPFAKVLHFLVDALVVHEAHHGQHRDWQEQKSNQSLRAFQPHVSRQVIFLVTVTLK